MLRQFFEQRLGLIHGQRVEASEKDRLEIAQTTARARFSGLMHQLDPEDEEQYWGLVPVSYEPYYAYEEVLAPFRDRPRQTGSMLFRMEMLAAFLNGAPLPKTPAIDEIRRSEGLAAYTTRSARDFEQELGWLGEEYERLRARMKAGGARTELMNLLVGRAQPLGAQRDAGTVAEQLFSRGADGARVVGLALARKDPQRGHIELAVSGIRESRSPFEQYHALLLASALLPSLHPSAASELLSAVESQLGKTIDKSDASRWSVAQRIVQALQSFSGTDAPAKPNASEHCVGSRPQLIVSIEPSSSRVRFQDGEENYGPWVRTRGDHALRLPPAIRLGRYLVTIGRCRRWGATAATSANWRSPDLRALRLPIVRSLIRRTHSSGPEETFIAGTALSDRAYVDGLWTKKVDGTCDRPNACGV